VMMTYGPGGFGVWDGGMGYRLALDDIPEVATWWSHVVIRVWL
jgi:hypothetical protein